MSCRHPIIVTDRNVSWPVDWIDWNVANSSVRAPRSVLFAHDADDVLCGLQYLLSTSKVKFNVRSGRHDYCCFSASFGAAVIDVSNLTVIDVNGHYVDVGAGVRLFELYAALESKGLMFGGGSCATVGVTGLVLGGGFGFQSRLYGMSSDNLLEADVVVVVNGQPRLLTVSEQSPYADLFWSLRGGGSGSFGVVTRLRLRVADVVPTVAVVRLAYAANLTSTLLAVYESHASTLDDTLTVQLVLYASSSAILAVMLNASVISLRTAMAPFYLSACNETDARDLTWIDAMAYLAGCGNAQSCLNDSKTVWPDPSDTLKFGAMSVYVSTPMSSNGTGVAALLSLLSATPHFSVLLFDPYGGAIARMAANATAFVHREALYHVQVLTYWKTFGDATSAQKWLHDVFVLVNGLSGANASYRNYPSEYLPTPNERYFGSNLARLRAVKSIYDADNLFTYKQAIN